MGQEALNVTCYDIFSIKLWLRFLPGLPIYGRYAFRWCRWAPNIYIFFVSLIARWSNGTLTPLNYRRDIATHLHNWLFRCGHLGGLPMRCAESLVSFFIWTWTISVNSRVICRTTLLLVSNVIGTAYFSISYSLHLSEFLFTLVIGVSSIIGFGALALWLSSRWSDKVVHGLLCFQHFCFVFSLFLANGVV